MKWSLMILVLTASLVGNFFDIFLHGFPIRYASFLIFVMCIIWRYFNRPYIDCTIYFLIIIFSTLAGWLWAIYNDGNSLNYIQEVVPFLLPALSFIVFKYISRDELVRVKVFSLKCLYIFAVVHISFSFLYLVNKPISDVYYGMVKFYFDSAESLDALPDNSAFFIPRLQVGMSVLLFFAIYLKVDVSIIKRRRWFDFPFIILLSSILVTQSRALIISVFLFFIFAFFLKKTLGAMKDTKLLPVIFISVILAPQYLTAIVIYFDLPSVIGLARGNVGDEERVIQLTSFLYTLNEYPLGGVGLGKSSDYIRVVNSPWLYELGLLSLSYKLGFIGIVVVQLMFLFFSYFIKPRLDYNSIDRTSLNLSFMFFFLFASNTNPYLQNFAGGLAFMIVLIIFMDIHSVRKNIKETC